MKVSPKVIDQLNQMHCITPRDRKQIERCVGRYSKPKTFSDTLAYIVYRIINAVKGIFGQSDRQIALRAITKEVAVGELYYPNFKKHMLEELKDHDKKLKNKVEDRLNNKVRPLFLKTVELIANAFLDQLINVNNGMDKKTANQITEKKCEKYKEKAERVLGKELEKMKKFFSISE